MPRSLCGGVAGCSRGFIAGLLLLLGLALLALWCSSRRGGAPRPRVLESAASCPLGAAEVRGYIIHLEARTDRERNIARLVAEAGAAGVLLSVMRARDTRHCEHLSVPPFWDLSIPPGHWRSHLRGGEQGCLASHLEATRALAGHGGFVLEDDATMGRNGFAGMMQAGSALGSSPCVLHGRRSYPNALDASAVYAEESAAVQRLRDGALPPVGWRPLRYPNYSNALYMLTPSASQELATWLDALASLDLHRVPADDLLSIACGAHPGLSLDPMRSAWRGAPQPPLTGLAPEEGLSSRVPSDSDTERREPLQPAPGQASAFALCGVE